MIEFREMKLTDFDDEQFISGLFDLNFVSKSLTISQIKEIFEAKRPMTDTYIAVDVDNNILIGHVAVSVHYSFNEGKIGVNRHVY